MTSFFPQKANVKFHSRNTSITLSAQKEYKELIAAAISDLEERLSKIEGRLQSLSEDSTYTPDGAEVALRRTLEEKDNTEKCLNMVADVSAHINGMRIPLHNNGRPSSDTGHGIQDVLGDFSAQQSTSDILQQCRNGLGKHASLLERHLRDLEIQISKFPKQDRGRFVQLSEKSKLQEEIQSTLQCLKICNDAGRQTALNRINNFEDFAMADNSDQIIVSTLGDLVSTRNLTVGARSTQWHGQMSDASMRQLSKSFSGGPLEKGMLTEHGKPKEATPTSGERTCTQG
jgi:hypothetical protein